MPREQSCSLGETEMVTISRRFDRFIGKPWLQAILGMLCMMVPGVLQYGWAAFNLPILASFGWEKSDMWLVQITPFVFGVCEACLMFTVGGIVDRWGPRATTLAAGIIIAISGYLYATADVVLAPYVTSAMAIVGISLTPQGATLVGIWIAAAVAGFASSVVTCAAVANTVKWFSTGRGTAAAVTVLGFALGAVVTILPMVDYIAAHGYQTTFMEFYPPMGVGLVVLALFLRYPQEGEVTRPQTLGLVHLAKRQFTVREAMRTTPFWVIFTMFTFMCMGGHLVTLHLGSITEFYKTKDVVLFTLSFGSLLWLGTIKFTGFKAALVIDRITNVISRPIFGRLSDWIGREYALTVAFSLEAVFIFVLLQYAHSPQWFALLSGAVFLAYGEIFVLIPAMMTDYYGEKHSGELYSAVYFAKGAATLWVPAGNLLVNWWGNWDIVFWIASGVDWVAALLALWLVLSLRPRMDAKAEA